MAPFPLGTQYVENMDVLDRKPYTPRQFPVIGDIEQSDAGNTLIRAGLTNSPEDLRWHQTLHLVLTPAEREELIAALIEHRTAAPAGAQAREHQPDTRQLLLSDATVRAIADDLRGVRESIEHRTTDPADAAASKKHEIESVTTVPRRVTATDVRQGDEMPLFVGTDLPCSSENIAQRDDDNIRWVRVDEIRRCGEGREFRFDDGNSREFTHDEFVVVRERVYLAD